MKKILIVAILFVGVVFALIRLLQHSGATPADYKKIAFGDNVLPALFPKETREDNLKVRFSVVRKVFYTFLHHKDNIYVSRVLDGDTIELSNGEQVRYIGIDTPELWEKVGSQWVYKPRPYAEEAKNFNQKLVEGKRVRLEFDVQKRDKYNRLLVYVFPIKKSSFSNNETFSNGASVGDTMVNLEMVRQGYAMLYTYPPNVKYAEKFLDAQRQARENNRGLWGNLEGNIISTSQAKENIGLIKMVTAEVLDTYLSEKVLILNCKDNFKVAIFRGDLDAFPKLALRSPDTYFKHKIIRVFGVIKEYKGACEIVVNSPSQLAVENREK